MIYVWVAVTVLAIVIEAVTVSLVSIWFIPGSVLALILSFFKVPVWVQFTVFIVVSVIMLLLAKFVFKKAFRKKSTEATNVVDAVIGKSAVVTERVSNLDGTGAVKVLGKEWSALAEPDGDVFEVGEIVNVEKIQGVKLVCKK